MGEDYSGTRWAKRTIALQNVSVHDIADEINKVNAGNSQKVIATMWNQVSIPANTDTALYDALIFYEVDEKALEYVNKSDIKLPQKNG